VWLFSQSSLKSQQDSLELLRGMLGKVRRTIQQPLASTLNWSLWDRSLVVALWLHAFGKWAEQATAEVSEISGELKRFTADTGRIALTRSASEWHMGRRMGCEELVQFVEEVAPLPR
jgi:hypothetical protein